MADLRDVMVYLCERYPNPDALSNARLTKLVYLADWLASITHGEQMTNIDWVFHNFGPFVHDVERTARQDPAFTITETINAYGTPKTIIGLKQRAPEQRLAGLLDRARHFGSVPLGVGDRVVLDRVIEATSDKSWNAFLQLVYSTYPVLTQPRYSHLALADLARDYLRERGSGDFAASN